MDTNNNPSGAQTPTETEYSALFVCKVPNLESFDKMDNSMKVLTAYVNIINTFQKNVLQHKHQESPNSAVTW